MSDPARGDVWWGEAPDAKGRPFLVLTRDEAIPVLRTVLVAPVTRTIRGIPTELELGSHEGVALASVASMDNLLAFPKAMLVRRMGALSSDRRSEICAALRAAVDC